MVTSFLLSVREGLEAALIIGIVLGALRKTGRTDLNRSIWAGAISALFTSAVVALILRLVDMELEGAAEQIYEGTTLLLAAGVLTWMIFWMFRQSKNLKKELESNVNRAANLGGRGGLFFLAFIAILREGVELALYLTAVSLTSGATQTISGTLVGLMTATVLGMLIYRATLRMNLQRFFQVTGILLILFAAGLIAQSVAEFNEAGVIPAIVSPLWNLNSYLADQSAVGTVLNTLFGYHSSPSLTMALGYAGYVIAIVLFYRKTRNVELN